MAEFDTSMFTKAPPPMNPLQAQNLQSEMQLRGLQMQQAQGQLDAQDALREVIPQSMGQDGQLDWNKVVTNLALHPKGATIALDVAQKALQNQVTSQELLGKHIENKTKMLDGLANTLGPYLEKGNDITVQDAMGLLSMVGPNGLKLATADEVNVLAVEAQKLGNGAPLAGFLRGIATRSSQMNERLKTLYGDFGQRTQEFTYETPEGAKAVVPKGMLGMTGGVPPDSQGRAAPTSPADRRGGSPSTLPAASGGAFVGQAPADLEAQKGNIKDFQDYTKQLSGEASLAYNVTRRLNEVQKAFKEGFTPGKGEENKLAAAGLLKGIGLEKWATAIENGDPNRMANAEIAKKQFLTTTIEALRQTLGGGQRITNLEVDRFLDANPSLVTEPGAVVALFKYMHSLAKLAEQKNKLAGLYEERVGRGNVKRAEFERQFSVFYNKHAAALDKEAFAKSGLKDLEEKWRKEGKIK